MARRAGASPDTLAPARSRQAELERGTWQKQLRDLAEGRFRASLLGGDAGAVATAIDNASADGVSAHHIDRARCVERRLVADEYAAPCSA